MGPECKNTKPAIFVITEAAFAHLMTANPAKLSFHLSITHSTCELKMVVKEWIPMTVFCTKINGWTWTLRHTVVLSTGPWPTQHAPKTHFGWTWDGHARNTSHGSGHAAVLCGRILEPPAGPGEPQRGFCGIFISSEAHLLLETSGKPWSRSAGRGWRGPTWRGTDAAFSSGREKGGLLRSLSQLRVPGPNLALSLHIPCGSHNAPCEGPCSCPHSTAEEGSKYVWR